MNKIKLIETVTRGSHIRKTVDPGLILGNEDNGYLMGDILDANATASLIESSQLQSDWNQTDDTEKDYIKNKPDLTSMFAAKQDAPSIAGTDGQIFSLNAQGKPTWINPAAGSVVDNSMSDISENPVLNKVIKEYVDNIIPAMAETLAPWADQKAIATPDTYTDAVRTTGGDIPVETSAGSKPESIKPVAGSKWTAKLLFNGSYNMLNAAKWGAANSQSYVGGVGDDFVYFLVPELTLGTFGTADENNGLLFTDSEGENVQPTSVYFKPLGATIPQSLTDGTSITPTSVNYDGNTYKTYETSGAGWLIVPKTIYDNDVCAHIAWEDWYDKYVSLDEPATNPEAVVGILMLEGLLALAHSDKYLRGVNDEVCDNVVFGETSATITHMVDELSVAANAWTNSATGESDSHGNALYRHSATVSAIKQGGAACVEGEDGGIPLTVNGTTVSYIDTNAAASASTVFYEVTATSTIKAYTDSIFNGSNINTETGVLPINDCSIEAQVGMDGKANITVKYAKNIVDQVAINATVDVPQIKEQVEEHEERITELEDTAVRTGSYDASVAVGLADNFKGDTIVDAEFYKRKTGGTQSVGSGIAAIKEMRGKSIVWNQIYNCNSNRDMKGVTIDVSNGYVSLSGTSNSAGNGPTFNFTEFTGNIGHKFVLKTTLNLPQGDFIFDQYNRNASDDITTVVFEQTSIYIIPQLKIANAEVDYSGINGYIMLFDLTLMFGAGNEPATVAEFEKMFPLDYYDYNAGEVIPFAGQNLVTTGFNQWDEEWENKYYPYGEATNAVNAIGSKNLVPVISGETYYLTFPNGELFVCYYDAKGNYIADSPDYTNSGRVMYSSLSTLTIPSGVAFIRFSYYKDGTAISYNHDICINIFNPDRNGTYEPYEKHTLPLDPSQWRDKQGNLVFPYGGMHGADTAYDYAKVDADGYIRKAVRCFDQVNMGTLSYEYDNANTRFYSWGLLNDVARSANLICTKYKKGNLRYPDKSVFIRDDKALFVKDTSYSTVVDLLGALQGVMLIYELAEPVEIELATPVYAKYLVDKDGTEEIRPTNGAEPYTTPANLSILYAMDARGTIANLPKNYLSKESAENMLNAMMSAGVIASYTMTWDASNNRYAFVITAPVEPEPTPESEETND